MFIAAAAAIVGIDAVLGDTAEFLNAWRLLVAVSEPLQRRAPAGPYIVGQDDLGAWAPVVAAAAWLSAAAVLTGIALAIARPLRRRAAPTQRG